MKRLQFRGFRDGSPFFRIEKEAEFDEVEDVYDGDTQDDDDNGYDQVDDYKGDESRRDDYDDYDVEVVDDDSDDDDNAAGVEIV